MNPIPLSLYIHFPWCVKKCPYCDFNSHALNTTLPEEAYIQALLDDCDQALPAIWGRKIHSIFMGGGTPSLFSPKSIAFLLSQLRARFNFHPSLEITLEANPGTVEQARFVGYKEAGINRISLGIQSFQEAALKALGRIHNANEAKQAIVAVQKAGFTDFNLDLMYALPHQTVELALQDLKTALQFSPPHLSWYELTLEPNTSFYHHPPSHLPNHDLAVDIEEAGLLYLQEQGFRRYEISAFEKQKPCHHNVNYWMFGDYLGIGAGAHSKLSDFNTRTIVREMRHKHPKDYLNPEKPFIVERRVVSADELPFEYALNTLRLTQSVPLSYFSARSFLPTADFFAPLKTAEKKGWVTVTQSMVKTTSLGQRFLNDLTALFIQ